MGNRAVIAHSQSPGSVAVYLHWNGGVESVLAFLEVCKARGYRDPTQDHQYGMARLIGVLHEFFDGDSSVGVGQLRELDVNNHDNGAYLIGPGWTIAKRWGAGMTGTTSVEQLNEDERKKFNGIVAKLSEKVPT